MQDNSALGRAQDLVRDLRERCPWDRAQTRETLRPYLVEETLELDAALGSGDVAAIREEMADLLLNIAFQLVLAEERGEFTADDVAEVLEQKMYRRHPQLFDLGPSQPWEKSKAKEGRGSILAGLPPTLPPLLMAQRLQQRAAAVGFDWPDTSGPMAKIREELAEVEHELNGQEREKLAGEIGDLLFAVVNLARKAGVPPSTALDGANRKFRHRFEEVETRAEQQGVDLHDASLEELDAIWNAVKAGESTTQGREG
ncbi:MAG: nucleoside triphosphate pyrophosphohydrolase [Gemmatimonadales bacterium]